MRKSVLLDTGFWIALYNPNDQYHERAISILDLVKDENMLIPWPTLYEFLNTRFTRNLSRIEGFANFIHDPILTDWIDDLPYRETALERFLNNKYKKLSLVDLVIREILFDINIKIDYLVTFNTGDFEDACQRRRIELLS